jgi:hypothetical protein
MRLACLASMAALATLCTGSAEAMLTPAPYRAEPVITLAAGGCGVGFHRNVYGACVVNGPGWGGGVVVAPGYYGYGAPGYWRGGAYYHGGYYHGGYYHGGYYHGGAYYHGGGGWHGGYYHGGGWHGSHYHGGAHWHGGGAHWHGGGHWR